MKSLMVIWFLRPKNGLLASCMLGVGRAVGETMAVLMATGNMSKVPGSIFDRVETMTALIASEMGETVYRSQHYQMLFVVGIVLFIITCSVNLISDIIIKGVGNQSNG